MKLTKLHRSNKNRQIAGVLGGIAEYIGWTPGSVRVVFLLLIILSAGVTLPMAALAYVILWIAMPEADARSYDGYDSMHYRY